MLAQAYGQDGKVEEGLQTLHKAFEAIAESGEHTNEAELYRLQGELLLKSIPENQSVYSSTIGEVEDTFLKSLTIAQHQEAKSWELRTTISLCKLMTTQNRHKEAYDLLKPIYEWFTEGYDTVDLIEAQTLLQSLQGEIKT